MMSNIVLSGSGLVPPADGEVVEDDAGGSPVGRPPASPRQSHYRWSHKGDTLRRSRPIAAYIGANGSGKSLAMIHDTRDSLIHGRMVLSTVRLIDPVTGMDFPNYRPLRTWQQLLDAEHCDVLFDEIVGIANARTGMSLDARVQLMLNQLRRRDICLRWTAPSWSRADVIIREVTQIVTVCRGYLPKSDLISNWPRNRLFRWTTYDAQDFATWSDNKEKSISGLKNAWLWRPGTWDEAAYDTDAAVDVVDSGEGVCPICGGMRPKRRMQPCTCDHE